MHVNSPSVLPTGSPFLIRLRKRMVGFVYGWFASNVGVSVVLLILILFSSVAVGQWTTPVPLNPSSGQQGEPYIAISRTGLIAVGCGEGPIAVYVSSDRGGTFCRTLVPLPAVPEYEMRGARGVAFDQQGNLFILWRWDETNGPFTIAEYYVLSKSIDSGATYGTFWQSRQPLIGPVEPLLHIDMSNTVHLVWDSTRAYPEIFRLHYTRFINGSPSNRVDHVLPRPQDTLMEHSASISVSGDTLEYAVDVIQEGTRSYYVRSLDQGATFSPFIAIDTTSVNRPILFRSSQRTAVLYGKYVDEPSPYRLPFVKLISDSLFPNSPSVRLGTTQMDLEAPKNLIGLGDTNYLVYQGVAVPHAVCYYEYNSLKNPPTDSAYFTTLRWPKLAIDSSGGKYLFALHRTENRIYVSRKNIVSSVDERTQTSNQNPLSVWVVPNQLRRGFLVGAYLDKPAEGSLTVFDILGREVRHVYTGHLNQGNSEFDVSTDNLASGVYFVSLRSSIGAFVTKFLITQ